MRRVVERVRWFFFGEMNFLNTILVAGTLLWLAACSGVGFVLFHFLVKYW